MAGRADNQLIIVQGVFQINGDATRFDGRTVILLASVKDRPCLSG